MKKFRSSQPVFHCEYLQEYYKAKLFNILGIFKYTPVDSQLLSVTSHGLNYVHFSAAFPQDQSEQEQLSEQSVTVSLVNCQYESGTEYLTLYQDNTGSSTNTDVTSFCCLACNRNNVWEGQDQCLPVKNVSLKRFSNFHFCLVEYSKREQYITKNKNNI